MDNEQQPEGRTLSTPITADLAEVNETVIDTRRWHVHLHSSLHCNLQYCLDALHHGSIVGRSGAFFISAIACLGLNTMYHTLSDHPPGVNSIYNKLDLLGNVCLI